MTKVGVHESHCCAVHGCKYGDKDCPVVNRKIPQKYPCEECTDQKWEHKNLFKEFTSNMKISLCETCKGTGYKQIYTSAYTNNGTMTCPACLGHGRIVSEATEEWNGDLPKIPKIKFYRITEFWNIKGE